MNHLRKGLKNDLDSGLKIVNLSINETTEEQRKTGVIELPDTLRQVLLNLLTFEEIPTPKEMEIRANQIFTFYQEKVFPKLNETLKISPFFVMIGGPAYLQRYIERSFIENYIRPIYAFKSGRFVIAREDYQPLGR